MWVEQEGAGCTEGGELLKVLEQGLMPVWQELRVVVEKEEEIAFCEFGGLIVGWAVIDVLIVADVMEVLAKELLAQEGSAFGCYV